MNMRIFTLFLSILLVACATAPTEQLQESEPLPASGPLPEVDNSPIGYDSVQEALEALRQKPGTKFRQNQGWIIVNDKNPEEKEFILWSFAPKEHPAYPAVAKRTVAQKNGAIWLNLEVLCEGEKGPCDQFVRAFQEMNNRAREHFKQ